MHTPESVLRNAMTKIFRNFEIQRDLLIPARISDLVIVRVKIKEKRKERQVLRPCQRTLKKAMEYEGDGNTNCNC